ncbi:bcl-2 homologous antagonist/killer-like [Erpetoichthys calabaricus]|uniref:Bcl-2 homologous antagonist/killer n=1 Tax=Erpetoichthys calabaricus TaxID=27687 RepID=A0A8C4RFL5_ERPCA|nr:bcl-2 homologous antagonist/killer-like [Erpetoichthys calabaricus]
MATGGEEDPFSSNNREDNNSQNQPDSEEQVIEETESVFCSYVFHRYQQESQTEEGEVPKDPEILDLQPRLYSTPYRVGHQLAIIGDDINRRYDHEFRRMLSQLALTPQNAYIYFCKIATSLFESEINWGRVIALLGFGYRMALHVFQQGITGFLSQIGRFIADFLLRNRIAQWIAQQGGWVAVLDLDNVYLKYMFALFAVVFLGHIILKRFFRS